MSSTTRPTVTIVGAGFSGLFALKHCLEYGLDATVYEAKDWIGGVWDPRSKAVLPCTECVSSKLYMGATDFPMDESYPEFPMHYDVLRYIESFADHFDLRRHIRTGQRVGGVERHAEGWRVALSDGRVVESDYVVLCAGLLQRPYTPGAWTAFQGAQVMHGGQYARRRTGLGDLSTKRILIVGNGDTACDIAGDLFRQGARSIHMSSRRGQWFQGKDTGYNRPADMYYNGLFDLVRRTIGRRAFERGVLRPLFVSMLTAIWGRHGLGLDIWAPPGGYIGSAYVKSREVLKLLNNGTVRPVRGAEPDGSGVRFINADGEPDRAEFDLVIVCTGYQFDPTAALDIDPVLVEGLYKQTFSNVDPSLAVVGNLRPFVTSIVTMAEFQSWRVAHHFAHGTVPDAVTRTETIEADRRRHMRWFPTEHDRLPGFVDPYAFTREVAREVGALDGWDALPWSRRLRARFQVFINSWTPAMYRMKRRPEAVARQLEEVHHHATSRMMRTYFSSLAAAAAGMLGLLGATVALWT